MQTPFECSIEGRSCRRRICLFQVDAEEMERQGKREKAQSLSLRRIFREPLPIAHRSSRAHLVKAIQKALRFLLTEKCPEAGLHAAAGPFRTV